MQKNLTAFSFLFNAAKPFKFYLALHLFVVVYNAIDLSLWPYISKLLINKLTATEPQNIILEAWPLALMLIIFTVLPGFVWRLADYSWMYLKPLMRKKITTEAMAYVMQHSHSFFQNNFSGSLASKVRDLSSRAPEMLGRALYSFLNVILSLLIAFVALLSIHKFFAFGLIMWAALFIFMAVRASKTINPLSIAVAHQQTVIVGNLVDILSNISNVRFFNGRRTEINKISLLQDEYTERHKSRNSFLIKFYLLHSITFSSYFAVCIAALIWLYSRNLVTLGDFLMLFTINNWIIHLMWTAANEMNGFLEDVGTISQALQIINQPLQIKDAPGAKDLAVTRGKIEFQNVVFSYGKDSSPLFFDKNIIINPGGKIGLVGHSGGGKTTFINLILRFFDLNKGRILIDGQDISQVTQESLRASIAAIPQDPSLFHRTLLENISYGTNASKAEIIEAAKKAHAHAFIEKLPYGYQSLVGERGVKLSGGQRQRIAMARAFLKNSPILILDEATSQLDSITEMLIQESLENLMQGKTAIVVAHRLSTLRNMDRILVFEAGKIIEDGSHQELIGLGGAYKKLWDSQIGGFIIDNNSETND